MRRRLGFGLQALFDDFPLTPFGRVACFPGVFKKSFAFFSYAHYFKISRQRYSANSFKSYQNPSLDFKFTFVYWLIHHVEKYIAVKIFVLRLQSRVKFKNLKK